ncbi:MAG: TetR family transcriptional regulator C-terminal domain-containing protein [Vicingaceae bacterium]
MAKKKVSTNDILSSYMNLVLAGKKPDSMYEFATSLGIKESELYEHYTSFTSIEKGVFEWFFDHTHELLLKDDQYSGYNAKNKLLSFYFTFFEIMTANRSYVISVLNSHKNEMESLRSLSLLRIKFKKYVDLLDIDTLDTKRLSLEKIKQEGLTAIAWSQLLTAIKFWSHDTSPKFEKTDLYIEKSLNASFDLIDIRPLESLIDLGKFLFKERGNLTY